MYLVIINYFQLIQFTEECEATLQQPAGERCDQWKKTEYK